MLEIKNTEVFGLTRAIRASGNPMTVGEINTKGDLIVGETLDRGISRAEKLGSAPIGSAHDHYLLGIHVQFDIKYPQYWTIEAERYHNFEIISSQSKIHRLTMMGKNDEFGEMFNKYVCEEAIQLAKDFIFRYNQLLEFQPDDEGIWRHPADPSIGYLPEGYVDEKYTRFMRCISNLPMGFEMWMTCDLTYLQIKTVYLQRRNHKLGDWRRFCKWCEELPMFAELTGITPGVVLLD